MNTHPGKAASLAPALLLLANLALAADPGVTVSTTDVILDEDGGQAGYALVLTSKPAAAVSISIIPNSQNAQGAVRQKVKVAPTSVTFRPGDWSTSQTITVTGLDDAIAEGTDEDTIAHRITSSAADYGLVTIKPVKATILDDDVARVRPIESGGMTRAAEGSSQDTYTLALTTQPLAEVTVTVHPGLQLTATPASVTFTPVSFSTPQTITVRAVDDPIIEGAHVGTITHSVTGDPAYREKYENDSLPIEVAITDNDVSAVIVSESGGSSRVTEGGAIDSYTLSLTKQPVADVTVAITPEQGQLSVSPASVTFSSLDFSEPQTVTVTAVDDLVVEESRLATITHAVSSSDFSYRGIETDGVTVHITDNDSRGVAVAESGGSTAVTEGGAPDHYTVALTARPDGDVELVVAWPGNGLVVTPDRLVFTATDFSQPRTVSVSLDDDRIAQGLRQETLTHSVTSAADSGYDALPVDPVLVSMTDNDTPGIALHETEGSTQVAEGGSPDTYEVVLLSQPVADVIIAISTGRQLRTEPATLTFTALDFDVPQIVTVTAVDDEALEGSHLDTVTHVVSSSDGDYAAWPLREVTAEITDNEAADNEAAGSGGSVSWLMLTVLPLLGIRRAPTSVRTALLAAGAALILAPSQARADPPYGDGFDAPETFETAVQIDARGADHVYQASFQAQDDVDFYKFSISQGGGTIDVKCWVIVEERSQPCASLLLDPQQVPQETNPSTWSYPCACAWTSHHVLSARPGEWRFRVTGTEQQGVSGAHYFTIAASGANDPYASADGGSIGLAVLCVLGAMIRLRRVRKTRTPPR